MNLIFRPPLKTLFLVLILKVIGGTNYFKYGSNIVILNFPCTLHW